MRARSLDHTATRSGAIARRAGAVALAAAVVAAPLAIAAPASAAVLDQITSVTFPDTELMQGDETQGYFNDNPALTQIEFDTAICVIEYKNDAVYFASQPTYTAVAPLQNRDFLRSNGYVDGDVYTVAYADATVELVNEIETPTCVAPPRDTPGLVQASITLVPTPEAPYIEVQLSTPDVKLTRGVAVNADIPFSTDGLDFTANGGFIGFGPQFGDEPAAGYVDPYTGIAVTILDEQTPGVTPRIHIEGTPKYSSVIETGFYVGDGTTTGVSDVNIIIADKDGAITPITIDIADGAAVAGAPVALITGGLKEGSVWNATVRSTPIVVGAGVIDASGSLSTTVSIPTGLAAGLHSITLASTAADGTPFTSVLYFAVSSTGTLLAVSATQATALAALPQLAATGTDLAPSIFVAGGLLLAGAAFVGVGAIRRRRNA
jgi:hypothetical protein